MGAGAAGSLTGAAELFRFWVFPDCTFLDISKAYELAHRKDFPICRFGGSIRIPKAPFLAWIEAKTYLPSGLRLGA